MKKDLIYDFCPECGALKMFAGKDGRNRIMPSHEAFSLALLDSDGERFTLVSREFQFRQCDGKLCYEKHARFSTLSVEINYHTVENGIAFKPQVSGIPEGFRLEWFDGPQVTVSPDGDLFWPLCEGVIVKDLTGRNHSEYSSYRPLGFAYPDHFYGGHFPGFCNLQFMAHYKPGDGGIYFGSHDPEFGPKAVEYDSRTPGEVRLSLQTFCDAAQNSWEFAGEYLLKLIQTDWMEAAEIYREWLPQKKRLVALPEWIEKSPLILIYPVRGTGKDSARMQENEYFPYMNGLSAVENIAQRTASTVMPLLMHWEGTAPWAPPYVWPPRGGENALACFRDALHSKGHLLGVYCSGSAWTRQSCIDETYSTEELFEKEHLENIIMRGPKGEKDASICCGPTAQRLGYDLCLATPGARKIVSNEIMKLADFGIDYAQYFDQNMGGAFHLTYCGGHGHPEGPGIWQTKTQQKFLAGLHEMIRSRNSKLVLGCEGAAADPYTGVLPLNEARSVCAWAYGYPVPAHSFVHHEHSTNFLGNFVCFHFKCDWEKCPENLLFRLAYGFNAGELLTVVLKSGGEIHWNWCLEWEHPAPDNEPVLQLLKVLNDMRRRYPEFLLYGKMQRHLHEVKGKPWTFVYKNGRTFQFNSIPVSTWEDAAGNTITFAVNFLPEEQTAQVDNGSTRTFPPLSVTVL